MSSIRIALEKKFELYRIVVWNDYKNEFQSEFENLELAHVTKVALVDNEFGLKIRMLRTEPREKFLVYRAGVVLDHAQNWLLDIELSQGQFQADQASLWLIELGLSHEFYSLSMDHKEFFASKDRRESLRRNLAPTDSLAIVQRKMIAVCVRAASTDLQVVLEKLLGEYSNNKNESMSLLNRFNLESFLWDWIGKSLEYKSEKPSIGELTLLLFKHAFLQSLGEPGDLHQDALVFLQRFRDSRISSLAYQALSNWAVKELDMQKKLDALPIEKLKEMDWFQCVEESLLVKLSKGLADRQLPLDTCADICAMRAHSLWAKQYEHHYSMLHYAEYLQTELSSWKPSTGGPKQTVERYCGFDYRIDQSYRKMLFHFREAGLPQYLKPLCEVLDGLYNNRFLLPVSNAWQLHVDAMSEWAVAGLSSQKDFFADHVQPVLEKGREKIYVIISDALRFEVAEELQRTVLRENRYEANLKSMIGVLPSYTQLGMAALLPGKTLAIKGDSAVALRDQMPTNGTEYRNKVLIANSGANAKAISSKDLMAMDREESRELLKSVSTLYVYHDAIDAVGDDRQTEDRLPNACEEAQKELLQIIKKLANANASNILITSDHGFQYRYTTPELSDFCSEPAQGAEILCKDRRFVYGHALQESKAFKKWSAKELGLEGNLEFLFPKSVLRLRLSGSGSRFVHGGTSLQEVVIPVLSVNIKRVHDVEPVCVDVIRRSEYITTSQVLITFYQTEASSEKQPGRSLRGAFYSMDGELLSDIREFTCDSNSESARDREQTIKFLLTSKVERFNNQDIELRLEERIGTTQQFKPYRNVWRYQVRKGFASDFE